MPLHLFEGYGVELEYMLVHADSLDVPPAVDQLMRLAGKSHRLVTGVVLLADGHAWQDVDTVALTMRPFDRREAEAYVDAHAPLDCVGSYRIEDAGIWLFDAVTGADPTSIMGLPLMTVARLLRRAGHPGPGSRQARPA